jgi:hypothetical protein
MKTNIDDTAVQIKRSGDASIDNMFDYSAQDVENEGTIEVVSSNVDEVLNDFKCSFKFSVDNSYSWYKPSVTLNPSEINHFVQKSIVYSSEKSYEHHLGLFMKILTMDSYQKGHNNFAFDLSSHPELISLFQYFKAYKNNPIKIMINGDLGDRAFNNSRNINVVVNGDLGWFSFYDCQNLIIDINGNVGGHFAGSSDSIVARINGSADAGPGINSENISLYVREPVGKIKYELNGGFILSGDKGMKYARYKIIVDKIKGAMK